jgi:NAD-reducing hydrogenase small subunit
VVRIDHSLPGCPPSADAFWQLLQDLIAGREPVHGLIRYD